MCIDRRPVSQSGYMHYTDGLSFLSGGSRQAMYCPPCQVSGRNPNIFLPTASQSQPPNAYRPLATNLEASMEYRHPAPPRAAPPLSTSTSFMSSNVCQICFDAPPNALLLPCAHLLSCASCTVRLLITASNREITGQDLLAQPFHINNITGQFEWGPGVLYPSSAGKCPLCRSNVRKWIRVYTA